MRATKDSGVDWLGEIPRDWEVRKFRNVFKESSEVNGTEPVGPMLSISSYHGVQVKEYASENLQRDSDQLENYRVVRPHQLAVNTMWLNYGGLGVSNTTGHMSPAYRAYWIIEGLYPRYVHHLMRSGLYVLGYTALLTGVRPNSLQMSRDSLMGFPILLPPLEEQRAIADFLDRETAKIDTLIAKQEQLITTLGERKRAELSKAVREGIYGSAMADSRYVWLGKTPKDWDTLPIWSILRIKRELVGGDWRATPLLSLTKRGIIPRDIESGKGKFPESFETYQLVEPDDLVFCHFDIEETPRTVGLVEIDGMLTGAYTRYVVINKERYDPKFLSLLFEDIDNEKRLKPFYTGLRNTMQKDRFASLRIALPSIGEQKRIVDFLERKISSVDKLASQAVSVNELLKERRQSLISAAVAGKIDLRRRAPR